LDYTKVKTLNTSNTSNAPCWLRAVKEVDLVGSALVIGGRTSRKGD
jgi:hypothetical protein